MASSMATTPRTKAAETVRREAPERACGLPPSLCAYLNNRIAACRLIQPPPTVRRSARHESKRTGNGSATASASVSARRTELPPDLERVVYFVDAPDVDPTPGFLRWWRYQGP